MKNKLYILFGVLFSLLLLNVVHAEGPYYFDFDYVSKNNDFALTHVAYQKGYLMSEIMEDGNTRLIYVDNNGKKLKEVEVTGIVTNIVVKDKDIYLAILNEQTHKIYVALYNENLEEIKTTFIVDDTQGRYYYNWKMSGNLDCQVLVVKDDFVAFTLFESVYTLNRQLGNKQVEEFDEETIGDIYPQYEPYEKISDILEDDYPYSPVKLSAYNSKNIAVALAHDNKGCKGGYFDPICYGPVLYFFDHAGNLKWSKDMGDYYQITEVKFIDEYLGVLATVRENLPDDDYKLNSVLLIYDVKGNLVQKINTEKYFKGLTDTPLGFAVIEDTCEPEVYATYFDGGINAPLNESLDGVEGNPINEKLHEEYAPCSTKHEMYYLMRNIETKVESGKGTIQAIKSSKPGEPVKFVITPAEGYVLGEVRVTDVNGNVLVFTDYTFTMPTADVLIEATFLPKNAETKDIAITLFVLLFVISGGYILYQTKKLRTIKK